MGFFFFFQGKRLFFHVFLFELALLGDGCLVYSSNDWSLANLLLYYYYYLGVYLGRVYRSIPLLTRTSNSNNFRNNKTRIITSKMLGVRK